MNAQMSPQQIQAANAQKAQQANMYARAAVLDRAINMWQPIYTATLVGTLAGQVVNVPIRNVGLIKRLVIEINGSFAQGAAETQNLTQWGLSNLLSNVTFTDLSNQTRINTTGWHLHALATARRQANFGASFLNDSPINFGSSFPVITAPAAVTLVKTFRMFYEVPLSYGDYDLRGAIYANVVNATMNLQFTINPNFSVGSATNPTLAAYQGSTAQVGTLSAVTVQVYQNYLDQVPMTDKGPMLPLLDLSTAYLLNNTAATGLSANQDYPIPYANFRNFMSTFLIYDNNGVLNVGSDIAYMSIQSANYTNIIRVDPFIQSLMAREDLGDDCPKGSYYFNHRAKPISTIQYGNMQLIVNPSAVTAGAQFLVGYEALAAINQITQAGSLYGA